MPWAAKTSQSYFMFCAIFSTARDSEHRLQALEYRVELQLAGQQRAVAEQAALGLVREWPIGM